VRPCDMFWMGVTSRFSLDMSTMIANDHQVWMVSEEGTCFEHCRGVTPFALPSLSVATGALVSLMRVAVALLAASVILDVLPAEPVCLM
jgi:hypothetical protein